MRARRVDANHASMKHAFERMGCSVADLSGVGRGVTDLLVAISHVNVLVEVKVPGKKLNARQQKFYAEWKGPKATVSTIEEAALVVGWMGEMARAVWRVSQQWL